MAYELKATLKLIDEMSAPMRRVAKTVTDLNSEVKTVTDSLEALLSVQKRLNKSMNTLTTNMEKYGNALKNTSKDRSKAVSNLIALGKAADNTTDKYKLLKRAISDVHNKGNVGGTASVRNTSPRNSGGGTSRGGGGSVFKNIIGRIPLGSQLMHYGTSYIINGMTQTAETMIRTGFSEALSGIKSAMDTELSTTKLQSMIPKGDRDSFSKANNGLALNQAFAKQAMGLSYHTMYSRNELIDIQKELYKSGMDYDTILKKGGLEQAAYLGVAGELDPMEAVTALVSSMNLFKKQGVSAKQVADSLAVNADVSAMDVRGLYMAQRAFGPTANMYGMKYNDMNMMLGMLANSGIKDQRAGTTLKYMFDYMINPRNNKSAEAMKKLGWLRKDGSSVFWDTKNNKIVSNDKMFELLEASNKKYEKAGKTNELAGLLKTVFGMYGKNGAMIFGTQGVEAYKDYKGKMTGLTAEGIHNQMMDTTPMALQELINTWDNFKALLAGPFLPVIKTALQDLATILQGSIPDLQNGAKSFAEPLVKWWKTNIMNPLNTPDMKKLNIVDKISFMLDKIADGLDKFLQSESGKKLTASLSKLMGVVFKFLFDVVISSLTSAIFNKDTAKSAGKGALDFGKDHPIISTLLGLSTLKSGVSLFQYGKTLFGKGGGAGLAGVEGAEGAAASSSLLPLLAEGGLYAALAYGAYKFGSGPLATGIDNTEKYFDKKHAEKLDTMYNKAVSDPTYLQSGGQYDGSNIPKNTSLAPATDYNMFQQGFYSLVNMLSEVLPKDGKDGKKTDVKNEQKVDQHYQITVPVHIENKTDKEGIISAITHALQDALPNKVDNKDKKDTTFHTQPR